MRKQIAVLWICAGIMVMTTACAGKNVPITETGTPEVHSEPETGKSEQQEPGTSEQQEPGTSEPGKSEQREPETTTQREHETPERREPESSSVQNQMEELMNDEEKDYFIQILQCVNNYYSAIWFTGEVEYYDSVLERMHCMNFLPGQPISYELWRATNGKPYYKVRIASEKGATDSKYEELDFYYSLVDKKIKPCEFADLMNYEYETWIECRIPFQPIKNREGLTGDELLLAADAWSSFFRTNICQYCREWGVKAAKAYLSDEYSVGNNGDTYFKYYIVEETGTVYYGCAVYNPEYCNFVDIRQSDPEDPENELRKQKSVYTNHFGAIQIFQEQEGEFRQTYSYHSDWYKEAKMPADTADELVTYLEKHSLACIEIEAMRKEEWKCEKTDNLFGEPGYILSKGEGKNCETYFYDRTGIVLLGVNGEVSICDLDEDQSNEIICRITFLDGTEEEYMYKKTNDGHIFIGFREEEGKDISWSLLRYAMLDKAPKLPEEYLKN